MSKRAVLAACAIAAALPGCTLLGRKVRDCEGFDVPLSVFVGPSRKELRSRVLASGVEETFPFVAEANADQMVIVGFTPLGTKSFTLTRKADDVQVENLIGVGLKVSPQNVMADVLARSVPSACATLPDGEAPAAAFDSWQVADTCGNSRPLRRVIRRSADKPGETPDVEVDVEYRPEAIIVRQKKCKYVATYVLQASRPIPGIDVKKSDDDEEEETAAQPASAVTPAPPSPAAAQPAAAPPTGTQPASQPASQVKPAPPTAADAKTPASPTPVPATSVPMVPTPAGAMPAPAPKPPAPKPAG